MRAEINENGQLTVIPESSVEAFALRVWWEDYMTEPTPTKPQFARLHVQFIERT